MCGLLRFKVNTPNWLKLTWVLIELEFDLGLIRLGFEWALFKGSRPRLRPPLRSLLSISLPKPSIIHPWVSWSGLRPRSLPFWLRINRVPIKSELHCNIYNNLKVFNHDIHKSILLYRWSVQLHHEFPGTFRFRALQFLKHILLNSDEKLVEKGKKISLQTFRMKIGKKQS